MRNVPRPRFAIALCGLFVWAGAARPECRIAVEQPGLREVWEAEQQAAGHFGSNITDLRPMLRELARFYPENASELEKVANSDQAPTVAPVKLTRIISENEEESVVATRGAKVFLCGSTPEAKAELQRIRRALAASFGPFPTEKGLLGDEAFMKSRSGWSTTILFRRRNAVVFLGYRRPVRSSKKDRTKPLESILDQALEPDAITLAKTLDQLLISAR